MEQQYAATEPSRTEFDALAGPAVIEFGTPWCGHCRAARPFITSALAVHPGVRHIRVEDGSGRPLGRSFAVTLWPTLVFLRDGVELSRLVRPGAAAPIVQALAQISADA